MWPWHIPSLAGSLSRKDRIFCTLFYFSMVQNNSKRGSRSHTKNIKLRLSLISGVLRSIQRWNREHTRRARCMGCERSSRLSPVLTRGVGDIHQVVAVREVHPAWRGSARERPRSRRPGGAAGFFSVRNGTRRGVLWSCGCGGAPFDQVLNRLVPPR